MTKPSDFTPSEPLTVQASLGYATYPDACETADELIQQAGTAMHVQKNKRRARPPGGESDGLTPVPQVFRRAESA